MTTPIDRAYANSPYIPEAETFSHRWAAAAKAFREGAKGELDVAYGMTHRERYDLFLPDGAPRGLVMFVHGGYWMAFDKSSWSHLAAGALGNGWAVVIPSYPLCPNATIPEIVSAAGAALNHAAATVDGPIVLTGHSAGGHIAARLATTDAPIALPVAERLVRTVPISGLHDLRPLMGTAMNETLRLTPRSARAESPVLLDPRPIDVVAWVGDGERPALRRQTQILAMIWDGLARSVSAVEARDRHHFDVVEDLSDPASPLTRTIVGEGPAG